MAGNNGAQDAADAQSRGAREAAQMYNEQADKAIDFQREQNTANRNDITGYYDKSQGYLNPYLEGGRSAWDNYLGGLGLNPNMSQEEAFGKFQKSPGYQFALNEGLKGIERNMNTRGLAKSGAVLKAMTRYGQDYASQEFGKWQDRLAALAGMGANMANTSANNALNTGTNLAGVGQRMTDSIANLYASKGENAANSRMAQANAEAQAAMANNSGGFLDGIGQLAGTVAGYAFGRPAGGVAGKAGGKLLGGG